MVRRPWLQQFLSRPDVLRPMSQQMPNFNLTEREVAVLSGHLEVAFVDPQIPHDLLRSAEIAEEDRERGKKIYEEKGCRACHQIGPTGGALGHILTAAGDRLEPGYLALYLKDPQSFYPNAAEPNYGLSDEEARLLTKFLVSLKKEPTR